MNDELEPTIEEQRHPRRRYTLVGHEEAERQLLSAYRSEKMHHGWILGGPHGIGKATLAYRFARFVLRYPDPSAIPNSVENLFVDEDDLISRRVAAEAHADLLTISPAWDPRTKKFKREIGAAEARKASSFFSRTAGEGGWRVCIVDPASAMNSTAANALLKTLEEPPARVLFLLVSDFPGKLMATIRSRCVQLDLHPLTSDDVVSVVNAVPIEGERPLEDDIQGAISWAEGSPGRAIEMFELGLQETLLAFGELTAQLPVLNRTKLHHFVDTLAARGAEEKYALFNGIFLDWLASRAHHCALAGETALAQNLAQAHGEISHSINLANALNLDKRQVLLQTFYRIEQAWGESAAA
ncbi:MAG: DNA polymerase III subunit delta' [Hyphomicrobiales bacterium]